MTKMLSNLKVAQKLTVAVGVSLALATIATICSVQRLSAINDRSRNIVNEALNGDTIISGILSDFKQYRILQWRYCAATSPALKDGFYNQLVATRDKMDGELSDYTSHATSAADKGNAQTLEQLWSAYRTFDAPIDTAAHSGNLTAINKVMNVDSRPACDAVSGQINAILKWNQQKGSSLADQNNQAYNAARTTVLTLLFLAIAVGLGLTRLVAVRLTSQIDEVAVRLNELDTQTIESLKLAVKALADGDLTTDVSTTVRFINADSRDELGAMSRSLNGMIGKIEETVTSFRQAQTWLSDLIGDTAGSAGRIAATSAELASASTDLSTRVSDQAASLEETTASMEEMTGIVKQSAQNAKTASNLATEAREVAVGGGEIVNKAVEAMGGIEAASKRIADIISVIDEIAFQTNLLALNAAVEAARVGEQGRGFAVVASEVRSLAGRSSAAAKEIKGLVHDSVQRVEAGTALVNQSGGQLTHIVSAVDRVASIVTELAESAQEQAAGIEQVNQAVVRMDEITQQNAALIEEAAASSEQMSEQANELDCLVGRFTIAGVAKSNRGASSEPRAKRPAAAQTEKGRPALKIVNGRRSEGTFEEF